MLFATSDLDEVEQRSRNGDLPGLRPARVFVPSLPARLGAGGALARDDLGSRHARRRPLGPRRVRPADRRRRPARRDAVAVRLDHGPRLPAAVLTRSTAISGRRPADDRGGEARGRLRLGAAARRKRRAGALLHPKLEHGPGRREDDAIPRVLDEPDVDDAVEPFHVPHERVGGLHLRSVERASAIVGQRDPAAASAAATPAASVAPTRPSWIPCGSARTLAANRWPPWWDERHRRPSGTWGRSALYTGTPRRAQQHRAAGGCRRGRAGPRRGHRPCPGRPRPRPPGGRARSAEALLRPRSSARRTRPAARSRSARGGGREARGHRSRAALRPRAPGARSRARRPAPTARRARRGASARPGWPSRRGGCPLRARAPSSSRRGLDDVREEPLERRLDPERVGERPVLAREALAVARAAGRCASRAGGRSSACARAATNSTTWTS